MIVPCLRRVSLTSSIKSGVLHCPDTPFIVHPLYMSKPLEKPNPNLVVADIKDSLISIWSTIHHPYIIVLQSFTEKDMNKKGPVTGSIVYSEYLANEDDLRSRLFREPIKWEGKEVPITSDRGNSQTPVVRLSKQNYL